MILLPTNCFSSLASKEKKARGNLFNLFMTKITYESKFHIQTTALIGSEESLLNTFQYNYMKVFCAVGYAVDIYFIDMHNIILHLPVQIAKGGKWSCF